MNMKTVSEAIGEIDAKYVNEAISYDMSHWTKKNQKIHKMVLLAAAIIAILALCGFAAYEFGLFDPWFQKPSADPVSTVQSAIEGQMDKEYAIAVRIEAITIDEMQTEEIKRRYKGSELAALRGWTDQDLDKHFVVVKAIYYVEYDHTKTFLDDGYREQYFYLIEDMEDGTWEIVDNTGGSAD